MLTRALFLAAGWMIISGVATLIFGRQNKNRAASFSIWMLLDVILLGDVWAVATFGVLAEVGVLSLVAFLGGLFWIKKLPNWNAFGRVLWSMTLLTTFIYMAYIAAVTTFTPLHPVAFIVALIFLFIELFALVLMLTFVYEGLDVMCRITWNRRTPPLMPVRGFAPKVSLHVPAYNEPPEVVAKTLRHLAKLDYPNFEVLVVDNNTPDEETWRPLELVCQELGPHFRCLHLEQWPGYKSGALNFALTQSAPSAEIIGIVDADYQVEPNFLRETIPAFTDPRVAFVQTPQDYRGYEGNTYLEAAYYGYKYFFEVSMPSRNEHNAIIFAGTMGLIRKSVLQEIGSWDEWCITEDSEASLRILQHGYEGVYINKSYGRGLIPFTFDSFKKQRFRWCFGGIQILKKHWESLMPWAHKVDPDNKLTGAQRYYYLTSGFQWYNDLLNLLFAFFLILGGVLSLLEQTAWIRPLTGPLLVMPAIFLLMGLWRFLWVLRHRLQLSWTKALATMGNFFSLGWAVTLASIQGLVQKEGIFLRTPKTKSNSGLVQAVKSTYWETSIGLLCGVLALTLITLKFSYSTLLLFILLTWQASLYLAAPLYSLLSTRDVQPLPENGRADIRGKFIGEGWAARWAIPLFLVILIGGLIVPLRPTREETALNQFQPEDVPAQQLLGIDTVPLNERGKPTPTLQPTPVPTLTPTERPTRVVPPTPVFIPTAVILPTSTPLPTATATTVVTPTVPASPTVVMTPTVVITATLPATQVPTSIPTLPGTATTQPTVSPTTVTATAEPSATAPPTQTSVPTATSEPPPSATPAPTQLPSETPPPETPVATPTEASS